MKKEEIAQNILDHFFGNGAVVTKKDWDFLLSQIEVVVQETLNRERT